MPTALTLRQPPMYTWSKRLNEVLQQRGWSQSELARRAGVSKENVKKYCQGLVSQPRGDMIPRLAEALDVHGFWLRDGIGPQWRRVPVVGYLDAGERFRSTERRPLHGTNDASFADTLVFDFTGADPIAVEVRGGSMAPVYRPGDVLLCSRLSPEKEAEFLDRDCVVQVSNGEGYARRVLRGSRAGFYRLQSYADHVLPDVQLAWAAPILWIRRGGT